MPLLTSAEKSSAGVFSAGVFSAVISAGVSAGAFSAEISSAEKSWVPSIRQVKITKNTTTHLFLITMLHSSCFVKKYGFGHGTGIYHTKTSDENAPQHTIGYTMETQLFFVVYHRIVYMNLEL
jgi:hypothetical protein